MKIYLATGNAHKVEEFKELVRQLDLPVTLQGAEDIGGMPEVVESGETLEENARIKAEALLPAVPPGAWVLADDSGLLVDTLNGAPGVRSARFAGPSANAVANNIKLLQLMRDVPVDQRTARFHCVLCFIRAGEKARLFKGDCEGLITTAPSGLSGFGYDPLFQPQGYTETFASLGASIKHQLSHRGKAVSAWAEYVRALGA